MSTGASGHTVPFLTPYMASKIAVEAITESIQEELRAYYIENASIQPGTYPTEMNMSAKAGLLADRADNIAENGEAAVQQFSQMDAVLAAKMTLNDPRSLADGVRLPARARWSSYRRELRHCAGPKQGLLGSADKKCPTAVRSRLPAPD